MPSTAATAWSALLRGGRRIDIDGGWYVEPQASVAWFHADGSRYGASNGLRVRADSAHSWVLRAGAEAGRQMKAGQWQYR